MATMEDIARRNIGTFTPPAFAPESNGHGYVDNDAEQAVQSMQRDAVRMEQMGRARAMAEVARMEAEAQALKVENDLEEEKARRENVRAQRLAELRAHSGGGDGAMAEMLNIFLGAQQETQKQLGELQTKQAESMRGELSSMRDLVKSMLDRPAPNALDAVESAITMMGKMRELAQQAAPTPAATPAAPGGQDWQSMIAYKRAEAELDMQRAKFNLDLAQSKAEREQWESEFNAKQARAAMLAQMLGGGAPQLVDALVYRISEGGLAPKSSALAATEPPKGPGLTPPDGSPPPPAPLVHPWTCTTCGTDNEVEDGKRVATCKKCETVWNLSPPGPDVEVPDAPS